MKKKIVAGILAHVDSGKTTLSEAMLYCSGSIQKLGRVDHKNSFLDTFALERSRGITIFSKQAVLRHNNTEFYLLDTPGHVDFSAETERTLQVLDYAVLVVSGTGGIQSHTLTLWRLLKRYNVPCFIFINKMDVDGTDRDELLSKLRSKLSEGCVDFGAENEQFYENLALCDESLLNEYYESSALSIESVAHAIKERKTFPCMFGSALKLTGVEAFMNCLDRYTVQPDYGEEFGAKVYKISEDNRGGRLTFMKITGGTLRVRDVLPSDKNTENEKVGQIRIYSGEKFTPADRAGAGTICAVTGVSFTRPGDGLGIEKNSSLPLLEPVLTYRLELPEGVDAHTAMRKMKLLENEDPTLSVALSAHGEILIRLMGEIQLEVLKSVIKERFGFDVNFGKGNIIYKETINNTVEGVGHFEPLRHYAEVHLILKPLKRDSGLVFKTECREDSLDKNWQRLILTHLYEKTHIGVLTGSPVTDIEISLVSGRAHTKHTEGGDFRQATYRAVRQGLRSAESVLLEPVYDFTLEVPAENIGRAISDIQRMSGSFEPPVQEDDFCVLTGTAPVAEMRGYPGELNSYTRGRGRLFCSLKGYEPCHNSSEVIEYFGYNPDNDVDNPCDSVFCSHGAGHTVKWDKVRSYMHLPSSLESAGKAEEAHYSSEVHRPLDKYRNQRDIFALDKELVKIFEQTYGAVKKRGDSEVKRHFKAENIPQKSKKYKKPPQFDGTEYILVDGYNVIYSWQRLKKLLDKSVDGARTVLVNILCNFQGYKKCELILVFDAYRVPGGREVEKVNGITIVYTKEAETADMYIEKASLKLAENHKVRVVTSDGLEQLIILGNGALRVPSPAFLEEIEQAEKEIRELINNE